MASRHLTLYESDLLQKSNVSPLRRGFETAKGPLILHSFCPPSLVTSLKADRGLHAFTHVPEREHQLLLGIAERPDSALTLAYTPGGEIVGQVTRAPADPWWQGVANMHEEETPPEGQAGEPGRLSHIPQKSPLFIHQARL